MKKKGAIKNEWKRTENNDVETSDNLGTKENTRNIYIYISLN